MRKKLLLVCVVWLAIIGGFVGYREYLLRTGAQVLLHTVPVDPRDLFLGDYVRLSYPISMIDTSRLANASSTPTFASGDPIYVVLARQDDGSYAAARVAKTEQSGALQIRGKVSYAYGTTIRVDYGIEQYYVPQGKGMDLQRAIGRKLDVIVVVSKDGTPAIKELRLDGEKVVF